MPTPEFDIQSAHRYFAADCFNKTWDLLENKDRTPSENLEMISACQASFWHWTQYEGHTPLNISIAYWQLSRVYAMTNQPKLALSFASLCLKISQANELSPFYMAYAYESLARASAVANRPEEAATWLESAKNIAESELESDEKQQLLTDLNTI
ncbi:hypothetical protein [uncultured Gimesia sp.]|uniref:hypothetical protein n=1 Tax=uncultured Gimesia sp. TaxID=1678688 RepID=UPI002637E666|nr:hypothetical protein [uncultured Gimesia sp.]